MHSCRLKSVAAIYGVQANRKAVLSLNDLTSKDYDNEAKLNNKNAFWYELRPDVELYVKLCM